MLIIAILSGMGRFCLHSGGGAAWQYLYTGGGAAQQYSGVVVTEAAAGPQYFCSPPAVLLRGSNLVKPR